VGGQSVEDRVGIVPSVHAGNVFHGRCFSPSERHRDLGIVAAWEQNSNLSEVFEIRQHEPFGEFLPLFGFLPRV
jgi:hypothetical protein